MTINHHQNRACIVVQNYYDIDPRVKREANALVESGWEVDVLALRSSSHPIKFYTTNNIHVFTLSVGKKRAGRLSYIAEYLQFFVLTSFWLAYQTFRRKYHIIQICTLPDFLVFAAIIPKVFGAKIILDMHEVMPEFYISKFNVPEKHIIITLLKIQEKASTSFADHVITVNQPIKDLLTKRGLNPSKVTDVMNLPDEKIFQTDNHIKWPRSNPPTFKIIYTGTLGERHGVQTAIKGVAQLIHDIPGIHLQIVGDGDFKPNLIELVHSLNLDQYVSFTQPIPLESIPDLLLESDVGICLQEGLFCEIAFPTKVPEYMLMNLPVVVSDNTITRLYFNSNMVVFVPPSDPQSFADKIRVLYQEPHVTTNRLMNARQFSKKWNWENEKRKYLRVFQAIASDYNMNHWI